MSEPELERINPIGMRKEWLLQKIELDEKGERHVYHEYANEKHAAIMRLHIRATENSMFRISELMNAMKECAKAYYPDIDDSEFFFTRIDVAENKECEVQVYFETISDRVVSGLGHISDVIRKKYKKKRWFELIMIKQKELEMEKVLEKEKSIIDESLVPSHGGCEMYM